MTENQATEVPADNSETKPAKPPVLWMLVAFALVALAIVLAR